MNPELMKKAHEVTDNRIKKYDGLAQSLSTNASSKNFDIEYMRGLEHQLCIIAREIGLDELEP